MVDLKQLYDFRFSQAGLEKRRAIGPNIRYAYREYWDFCDHYLPLSHLALVEGLMLARFQPERVVARFLPHSMPGRLPTADFLIKAYLAFPLAWRFFGKQFLVIARKPA